MPFTRIWDESCPRVWDKWEANGLEWVVQDLDPKDDEEALKILVEHLCSDELLCSLSKLTEDNESVEGIRKFWIPCIAQRMCLGCYTWVDGKKTLVALNLCIVMSAGDTFPNVEITGEKWKNVYKGMEYVETKRDPHKYLELSTLLHAFGLVVKREYRGCKLGAKLLAAREPLCKLLGVKGTTTVFSGPASPILAARCGFVCIYKASLKELADSGLDYPPEPNTCLLKRNWDASCPRVWDKWEANGQEWVVQDLDPKDDEEALIILVEHLCTDEILCSLSKLSEDEESIEGMKKFWVPCIAQRMSLALYTWVDGKKTLVALNVCVVMSSGDTFPDVEIKGERWKNVFKALEYVEIKRDPHKYLKLNSLLHAFGLVVKREYRGQRLGAKLLDAREPLSKAHGINGTTTVFTGPASQKLAASCGFESICEASWKDLADSGLDYPPETNKYIKLMVKRFV